LRADYGHPGSYIDVTKKLGEKCTNAGTRLEIPVGMERLNFLLCGSVVRSWWMMTTQTFTFTLKIEWIDIQGKHTKVWADKEPVLLTYQG